jgi:hypothetical protein
MCQVESQGRGEPREEAGPGVEGELREVEQRIAELEREREARARRMLARRQGQAATLQELGECCGGKEGQ